MSVDQDGLFEETTWPPFLDLPSWRRPTCAEPQVGPPHRLRQRAAPILGDDNQVIVKRIHAVK
jgi:hypothetical protein